LSSIKAKSFLRQEKNFTNIDFEFKNNCIKIWRTISNCRASLANYFHSPFIFFHFFQKYQIKNILTFLHFLYHINNYLLQNKTFSLFYKTFSNFILHQSLFTIQYTNIPQPNYLPNKPVTILIIIQPTCINQNSLN